MASARAADAFLRPLHHIWGVLPLDRAQNISQPRDIWDKISLLSHHGRILEPFRNICFDALPGYDISFSSAKIGQQKLYSMTLAKILSRELSSQE